MKALRVTVLISFVLALALAVACSSAEPPDEIAEELEGVLSEAPETPSDIAIYRGSPARTGVYETEGVLVTPEAKWVFQTDRAIRSSAVVIENKVLFGSDDGNFYALDAETGTTVWTFETERQVRTSPLVADGVVYFGADDLFMSALDLDDGEVVWRSKVGMFRSSPVVAGGTIFFGSDASLFHAYDARTGLLTWETAVTPRHVVRSSPAVVGDTIFVTSVRARPAESTLFALERLSGDELWSYPMEGRTAVAVATGAGAVLVATSDSTGTGRLYAVEQDSGELRWMSQEEDIEGLTSPALTDELVIWGIDDRVVALDIQTSEVEWVFEAGSPIESSPSVAGGLVYFGAFDGKVRAVDIVTGQKRWEFQTDIESDFCSDCGWIVNAPVISNGVLYVGNGAGYFYALEAPSR